MFRLFCCSARIDEDDFGLSGVLDQNELKLRRKPYNIASKRDVKKVNGYMHASGGIGLDLGLVPCLDPLIENWTRSTERRLHKKVAIKIRFCCAPTEI